LAQSSIAPSLLARPSVAQSSIAPSLLAPPSVAQSSIAPSLPAPPSVSIAPSLPAPPSVSQSAIAASLMPAAQSRAPLLAEPPAKRVRANPVGSLSKELEKLDIVERGDAEKVTRDLKGMNLGGSGAIPKKRPPPLNLPLIESVVLDRRQRGDDVRLPQLVESTMPPTRDSGVFQFPEKTESSESGVRLKNAKELSDVLLEIKERNNDDLTALDDIDSLLSRAFGVVS